MHQPPSLRGSVVNLIPGWIATVGLIAIAVFRTVAVHSPQLYWMVDPRSTRGVPSVEIGPAGAAIVNWLCVAVLALAVIDRLLRSGGVRWWLLGLWAVGGVFALGHGLDDAESLRIGGDWLAALALGLAAMHLGSDTTWRRLILAAMIGLILPLAAQAIYQVAVEHPMTVQSYEDNKAEILRQRGWAEGSTQQLKYEERLKQVEATARFGFSNIFGTVMATLSLLAVGAAAAMGVDKKTRPTGAALGFVAAFGLLTLGLTFSKGAILALIVGVGVSAAACVFAWRFNLGRKFWGMVALAVVVAGIGSVIVRGVMGPPQTPAGERSLLFRYYYWQAGLDMLADRPIDGIGPGQFQAKYLTAKNPLSPEEVSDPHNVLVAYVSTLGLGGAAWALMLLAMVWRTGRCMQRETRGDAPPLNARVIWSVAIAAGALAFVAQYAVEWQRYWIDTAVLWIVTSGAMVFITGYLARRPVLDTTVARLGLFAAAATLVLHSQIEMTLTNTMAAPLMFALLGVAGSDSQTTQQPRWRVFAVAGASAAVLITLAVFHTVPIVRQQMMIADAAHRLQRNDVSSSINLLARANAVGPYDARLAVERARLLTEQGHPDRALRLLADARTHRQRLAQLWRTEATIADYTARRFESDDWLQRAAHAAEQAIEHDPYGIEVHLLGGDLAWRAGRRDKARRWYRRALELSDQSYLDPNKQIADELREQLRQRLGDATSP